MNLLTEDLVAKTASERPYVLMHSHMPPKLSHNFATDFAIFEDPFTGLVVTCGLIDISKQVGGLNVRETSVSGIDLMQSHMHHKVVKFGEGFSTDFAIF